MALETNDPAGKGGAGVLLGGEPGSFSGKPAKTQGAAKAATAVSCQRVTGDLGPVALLAKPGAPPPAVVIERRSGVVRCWIEYAPWGWDHGLREFLDPHSPRVEAYAKRLALKLREAAIAERDRRQRIRALQQAEREAMQRGRT